MHVVIFEGSRWPAFAPLTLSRPVFSLLSGTSTLLRKQMQRLGATRLSLWVRPELADFFRARLAPKLSIPTTVNEPLNDEQALLWNGRLVPPATFNPLADGTIIGGDDDRGRILLAGSVRAPGLSANGVMLRTAVWLKLCDLPRQPMQGWLAGSLPDLIHASEKQIIADAATLPSLERPVGPYHVIGDQIVSIDQTASIGPGVVIDATKGPVVIDVHAIIGANSVLNGPCYIGRRTFIRPLTLIRAGCSIGPYCNVGGEVSNAIMLANSNKAHDGYLGDSYLGEWINLGAGTTTSNLKNTYGEITIEMGNREVTTGKVKLGVLIGDHSKTAILTRLTTGTYIGYGSMIATTGPAERFVASYSFCTDRGKEPYRLEKAMEVAAKVFQRRELTFTPHDESLMRYVASIAPAVEGTG